MNGPYRLRLTQFAAGELQADLERIRKSNPLAARRYAAGLRAAMNNVLEAPELGSWVEEIEATPRYRQRVYRNHRIIYRCDGPYVVVVRIFDGRRNPDELEDPRED